METSPPLPLHVAITAVFDPSTVPGGYSFRRVRQLINDRIPFVPVFQRRLVEVPMRLGRPDLGRQPQVRHRQPRRRAALPCPRRHPQLGDFAATSSAGSSIATTRCGGGGSSGRRGREVALVVDPSRAPSTASRRRAARGGVRPGVRSPGGGAPSARQLDSRVPVEPRAGVPSGGATLVAPFELAHIAWRTAWNVLGVQAGTSGPLGQGGAPAAHGATHVHQRAVRSRRRVAFAAASLRRT